MTEPATGDRLDAAVVLAVLLIIGGAVAALAFVQIPKDNMPLFAALVSGLTSSVIGAYAGFRFGSSKSSALKDAVIASQLPKGEGQ